MLNQKIMLLLATAILTTANSANAELPQLNPQLVKPGLKQIPGKVTPQLQLKPDLVIERMGYTNEFCVSTCDQWSRELSAERITAESCAWNVTVKNIGSATSSPGKVQVEYDSLGGNVRLLGNMPSIRPGQMANVVVPFNNSRMSYLYRKIHSPFNARADSTNSTVESNEGNNTKTQR